MSTEQMNNMRSMVSGLTTAERIELIRYLEQSLIRNYNQLTITPISKDKRSNSYVDYAEQEERNNWCWDDSEFNKSEVGQLFVFFFPQKKVVIHRIESIHDPTHRLPSWTKNVGQSNRNVLKLSEKLREFTMDEWQRIGGQMKQQGTYTSDLRKWRKRDILLPILETI